MKDLPEKTRECINRAIRQTAFEVMRTAQGLVRRISGDLAGSIIYYVGPTAIFGKVGLEEKDIASRGGQSSHRHPNVYGIWSEFGRAGQEAHPFMRPAAEAHRNTYIAKLQAEGKVLERLMAK